MKQFLLIALFLCIFKLYAQEDVTLAWDTPVKSSGIKTVSLHSVPLEPNYYEEIRIGPKKGNAVLLSVNPDQALNVQVSSRSYRYLDENILRFKSYLLYPKNTDSLFVYFITLPEKEKVSQISYSYLLYDTTKIVLSKHPEKAFEQLLRSATVQFLNLYSSNVTNGTLEFPHGVFAPQRATKDINGFFQYTGFFANEEEADAENVKWNTQIKLWLKDYKMEKEVTLSKDELQAKSNFLYSTATEYKKLNKDGVVLFVVSVFKSQAEEGFYTGVRISSE